MQMNRATLQLVEVGRVRDGAAGGRNPVGEFYKLNCKIPVVPVSGICLATSPLRWGFLFCPLDVSSKRGIQP